MSLMFTTRFDSARFLLVCEIWLLFGSGSHLQLWRARVGSGWSTIHDESGTDSGSGNDPRALIGKADHFFYCLSNGTLATPPSTKAKQLFAARRYIRNSIHAKSGHLRSEAETIGKQIEAIVPPGSR